MDITEDERRSGFSHDLARASFSVERNTFNLLDVPGDPKYAQEMIKGASLADFAVLVISAKKSDDTETYRSQIFE